jgi:hypothetical protein
MAILLGQLTDASMPKQSGVPYGHSKKHPRLVLFKPFHGTTPPECQ